MKRPESKNQGFTLVELIFAIAIILILGLISLPVGIAVLEKADDSSADASIREIATALTAFFSDLKAFPTCASTDCSPFPSSSNNKLVFLAFGDGFEDLSSRYPDADTGAGNWDFTANDETVPGKNNGANHLAINDPDASDISDEPNDYFISGKRIWRGPYIAQIGLDAWGRTFIAYVGAMEKSGRLVAGASGKQFGWVISAGPDNFLQTTPSSKSLQNDDRGFVLFSR